MKVLARTVRQLKEIKEIQFGKEEVKVSIFADDMIGYLSNPKNSTRKFLQLINAYNKVAGYKINSKISVSFLYANNNWPEKEIREPTSFTTATNNKISCCNSNQASERSV